MGSDQINKRCRACLSTGSSLYSLDEKYKLTDENVSNLYQLLQVCASLQTSLHDGFPQFICEPCFKKASDSYQFRLQCEKAELQLQAELQAIKQSQPMLLYDSQIILDKLDAATIKNEDAKHIKNEFRVELGVPVKQRTCDQCGKEFKYRTSMIKHKRKHGLSSFPCTYCNQLWATPTLLAKHMEQMHAHLKNITCTECGKTFFKQANLRLHMNIHSGIKRHMCDICGVSFALAGNLAAHRRLHTGLKPYVCNHCGRGFTQQASLRSHEAGHSDRKDHVCSECGAAFSRAGALRNHCKRHLPSRPFVCPLCNKAFIFSSEKKRHMTIHTGEKNHECHICGSRFNRSTNLAVHRRIHTGETPHVCTTCGKRFSQAHCLRTHMTTHTNACTI